MRNNIFFQSVYFCKYHVKLQQSVFKSQKTHTEQVITIKQETETHKLDIDQSDNMET